MIRSSRNPVVSRVLDNLSGKGKPDASLASLHRMNAYPVEAGIGHVVAVIVYMDAGILAYHPQFSGAPVCFAFVESIRAKKVGPFIICQDDRNTFLLPFFNYLPFLAGEVQ
ncbi:hypothetical protein SDC9_165902 [bioreactor metagenome]|uniref:Uncharacterized protein n=1 Tax=bioreactor metagenome TaxID=1076179 RepID=A0A645FXV2_9ZZZZ